MSDDARFEDADTAGPLKLLAASPEDLGVIAALAQDAVAQTADMSWLKSQRRFVLLLNRFRWEDAPAANAAGRPLERVQSLLVVDSVLDVQSQGVAPGEKDTVLSLLSLGFDETTDAAGHVTLTFAGDGAIRLEAECLDVKLKDVSRPYLARVQQVPSHSGE